MYRVHMLHTTQEDFWADSLNDVVAESERDYYEHIRNIAYDYAKTLRIPATVEMGDPMDDGIIAAYVWVNGVCNTQVIGEPVTW